LIKLNPSDKKYNQLCRTAQNSDGWKVVAVAVAVVVVVVVAVVVIGVFFDGFDFVVAPPPLGRAFVPVRIVSFVDVDVVADAVVVGEPILLLWGERGDRTAVAPFGSNIKHTTTTRDNSRLDRIDDDSFREWSMLGV